MVTAEARIAQGSLPDWCKSWFTFATLVYGSIMGLSMLTFDSIICTALPVVCFMQLLLTVGVCYVLFLPRIEGTSIVFPAISELGIYYPEKIAYQLGFGLVGVMLFTTIRVFDKKVAPHLLALPGTEEQVVQAVNYGYYAALGVILQGVFTLNVTMSPEVALHFVGAFVFCSYGMNHCNYVRQLFEMGLEAEEKTAFFSHPYISFVVQLRGMCLDKFPLLCVLIPVMFQGYQVLFKGGGQLGGNANPGQGNAEVQDGNHNPPEEENPTIKNIMGLVQWLIILQVAVYFFTYAVDFWVSGLVEEPKANKVS